VDVVQDVPRVAVLCRAYPLVADAREAAVEVQDFQPAAVNVQGVEVRELDRQRQAFAAVPLDLLQPQAGVEAFQPP
jgi:hypothetical protein